MSAFGTRGQGSLTQVTALRTLIAALVVLGMLGLGPANPARAATRGIGCPNYDALASAIAGASSGDVLTLACSAPTTIAFTGTITIRTNVTLDASASPSPITLDGQASVRLFVVAQGAAFALNSLTVYRGWVVDSSAGGGGAVYNLGTLSVTNSTFRESSAGLGGAIDDAPNSSLTITKSAFLSNSAVISGGAIFGYGVITITSSTFSGNSAPGGGAIFALSPGSLTISNSTIARNSTGSGRGAVQGDDGMEGAVWASIFASNSGGNCRLPSRTQDKGYNLTDTSGNCGLTKSTDLTNTDPKVSPPADNGGPTQTMALAPTSPAIDEVPKALCPATDQRGVARPAPPKTACDIGAYEYVVPPIVPFNAVQQCKNNNLWPTTSPPPLPPSSTASAVASAHRVVAGWVFLDGSMPVQGATVRLVAPDGRWLSRNFDTTNANGVFILHTGRLPSTFRVVAFGGSTLVERVQGTLTTRVTGYQHLAPLYVDPATTLVDRYLALNRDATMGQATARVKHLLGVPAWASLGSDLQVSDRYFNGDAFLQQAAQHGGVDHFTRTLTVAAGQGRPHTFHATGSFRKMALINPAADWLLEKAAGGAVSYGAGKGLTWVLGQIGVKSDTQQLSDQLATIQSQLVDVLRNLQDVKAAVAELNIKISENYLATVLQGIKIRPADIDNAEAGIKLVADAGNKPAQERETLACGVLYYYVQPVATSTFARNVYQAYTRPDLGVKTLMQAYADIAKAAIGRWFTDQSSQEIVRSVGYWETYQALFTQVVMEWQHANGCPGSTGCTDVTQLVPITRGYAAAEEQQLPKMLPKYTFIDTKTGMMWAPTTTVQPLHDSVTITAGGQARTYFWGTSIYRSAPLDEFGVQDAPGALSNLAFVNATNAQPAGSPSHRDLFGGFSDWHVADINDWRSLTSDWTLEGRSLNIILAHGPPFGPGIDTKHDFFGLQAPLLTHDGSRWRYVDWTAPPALALSTSQVLPIETIGWYFFARSAPNAARYWTAGGGSPQEAPNIGPTALPYVSRQPGGGHTAGFDVFFDSSNPGDGRVLFGPGPGCAGLTGTSSRDENAGTTAHLVHVTGDEANLSAGAILPGATYSFEVVTVTNDGVETDDNGGQCYSVTIPSG